MSTSRRYDAVVIGGGPAGLATSQQLTVAGVPHLVLERGDRVAYTWANLYDGLVLHTGKRLSALPGMPFPSATPTFPTRDDLVRYLESYARRFELPIETRADVSKVARENGGWIIQTAAGAEYRARALVVATGIVSTPNVPRFPNQDAFRGRLYHSVEYRRPDGHAGRRVLVVGAGNSAGDISVELAQAGATVFLAVRSGTRVVPRSIAGIPTQYLGVAIASLPRPAQRAINSSLDWCSALTRGPSPLPPPHPTNCPDVPLIGFHLADTLRAGKIQLKGGLAAFTSTGVRFADGSEEPFDEVMLATGYAATVGMLGALVRVDGCGFARRHDRVVSDDHPNLYFVGHNYDTRGGLYNIGRDAQLAARHITRTRGDTPRTSTGTPPRRSER